LRGDDVGWRRDPVGEFNTQGQGKCPHCGGYFPENWVVSHINGCASNPANQATNETDDE
jgi:hypothetical protein